ncbi:MAG: hypothetical protein GWP04_09565 [Gammaproteobacteria bacterium]|nr:hypothetical protein [Gammaproteobacteria bacterium]
MASRRTSVVIVLGLLLAFAAAPVQAQTTQPNPIDEVLQFFDAPENEQWTSRFLREPTPGKGQIEDPTGDFVHSSGDEPGFTPDHIDITDAWAADLSPGGPLFGPTDGTDTIWVPGPGYIETPDLPPLYTFTNDMGTFDGSQFSDGAYLFGFDLRAMPPPMPPGRCEYVVWINDVSRPDTFENHPSYPLDPAGGTNMAFGIGLSPEEEDLSGAFMLDLTDQGFFTTRPEYDIRGVIVGLPEPEPSGANTFVGIFVPKGAIGELGGANFYSFCVREGFSFDAADTGSDQTGLIGLGFADMGQLEVDLVSTVAPVETTTPVETITTATATTTTEATTTSTAAATTATTERGFPWGLVLLGGLGLAIVGWYFFKKPGTPCEEEYAAWQAALAECERAQAHADDARQACSEAREHVNDLKQEYDEVCLDWPPACWTTEDGGWVEDDRGNRVTSRDLHLRKMALGELWDDYKAGNVSAQQVEEAWKKAATPEFRDEMRDRDAEARAELERLDAEIAEAEAEANEACDAATQAQEAADAACEAADAARLRYEECVGRAMAGAGSEGGTEGPSGPSGPGIASGDGDDTGQRDPCEGQPKRKAEPAGPADRINVTVDFSMFVEAEPASKHGEDAGEQIVFDLQRIAQELDLVGDLMSARGAGLQVAGNINGYAAGKYVASTAGVIKGGIDATLAATDIAPDVPTTPAQAGVELLESVAKLAGFITGKVTEWMQNNRLMTARVTYFWQEITATPYLIMECRTGEGWVCVEKVWEIEISKLHKRRGPRSRTWRPVSDLDRSRMERDFRRLAGAAANTIKNHATNLARWRSRHEPGPCP